MTDKLYDVIIAGAGPIGLFLACELGLAGTSVLVLERDAEPGGQWKTEPLGWRGLSSLSVETFYRRGLLDKCFNTEERARFVTSRPKDPDAKGFRMGGHFAGIMLNANKMEMQRWKYKFEGPSLTPGPTTLDSIERALTERIEGLDGVQILRGSGVTGIKEQNDEEVIVEAGEKLFRGKWLVGCDGGRSVVRKAARFDFVGTEAKFTGYVVKCELDHPEKLKPGFNVTDNGMYIRGLPGLLHLLDFDGATFDRKKEITKEHVQDVLDRVIGTTDVKITTMELVSTFTDRSKQATSYRKGRVLLAGDAAHIHPPLGSQGLNLGLGDAMNLGWKLAATLRGERGDLTLLDTYESERHPIAAWVLEWTRGQVVAIQPDLYGKAVRALLRDLIDTSDGTNLLIDRVWGLSQRYNLYDGAHELAGSSAPDFELLDGTRLGTKLESGKGLLLDFEDRMALKSLVVGGKYDARVDYIGLGAKDKRGLSALLIRPDGIVAWVAEENMGPDIDVVKSALEQWFGV